MRVLVSSISVSFYYQDPDIPFPFAVSGCLGAVGRGIGGGGKGGKGGKRGKTGNRDGGDRGETAVDWLTGENNGDRLSVTFSYFTLHTRITHYWDYWGVSERRIDRVRVDWLSCMESLWSAISVQIVGLSCALTCSLLQGYAGRHAVGCACSCSAVRTPQSTHRT